MSSALLDVRSTTIGREKCPHCLQSTGNYSSALTYELISQERSISSNVGVVQATSASFVVFTSPYTP
jgi:hypothetical protein